MSQSHVINTLLIGLSVLVPSATYLIVIVVAALRSRWLVATGAALCLIAMVAGYLLRVLMVRYVAAAELATYIPILNLAQTILSTSGWLLIAWLALRRQSPPAGTAHQNRPESGNPYESVTQ